MKAYLICWISLGPAAEVILEARRRIRRLMTATLQMKGRGKSYMNVWFPFMYSQKWNCSFQNRIIMFCLPVPRPIYLWEIYISPGSVCLLCYTGKYVDQSWEYINRSQTHECGNCDWGHAIPRKGIFKWDFPCSVGPPSQAASRRQETVPAFDKEQFCLRCLGLKICTLLF